MTPADDGTAPVADPMAEDDDVSKAAGGLGAGGSSYVPPHLRNKGGASAAGERMGGKYERDDLATLRVTNVSFSPIAFLLFLVCFPNAMFTSPLLG